MEKANINVQDGAESEATKTSKKSLPDTLLNAVNKKFGLSEIANLDEV